jgi:hypothetical protein
MRLDISGHFVVRVVAPEGGWSKGRPIALIEADDRWSIADLLIPNGLSDRALETFVAAKFASFVVAGKPIRRLDIATPGAVQADRNEGLCLLRH